MERSGEESQSWYCHFLAFDLEEIVHFSEPCFMHASHSLATYSFIQHLLIIFIVSINVLGINNRKMNKDMDSGPNKPSV